MISRCGQEYCHHELCWRDWLDELSEPRYESVEMILRERSDGVSWFDFLFDLITENCEGSPETDENSCTCGLETMGGTSGTLDQCYKAQTQVGRGLQPIDLAYAIVGLHAGIRDENILKVLKWAEDEIYFEENFFNGEEDEDS